jgi:hypothetical protein
MAQLGGIADITTEQFDRVFKTNVYAMFWLCKAAVPHMQPGSTIINTSSIQAYTPSPELLDYATSKGAIVNFTRGLAQQLTSKGIRVNHVAPGPIWTPLIPATMPEEKVDGFGEESPMGRVGQPAEVAPAFVFLASNESSYTTGSGSACTAASRCRSRGLAARRLLRRAAGGRPGPGRAASCPPARRASRSRRRRPRPSTTIRSASTTVDSRCAMTSTVVSGPMPATAEASACSLRASSEAVGSSSSSSAGRDSSARAIGQPLALAAGQQDAVVARPAPRGRPGCG